MRRPLVLFGVLIAVASGLGLLANAANFSQPVVYALIGATIALAVTFGLPYAFRDLLLENRHVMHADEATVGTHDHEDGPATTNGEGLVVTQRLEQASFVWDAPVVLTARWTESATAFRVEALEEFIDVGHEGVRLGER